MKIRMRAYKVVGIQARPGEQSLRGLSSTMLYGQGFTATFLILKGVQDASERSVVPASLRVAMAREPLNQPSRFGLTSAPQAL